MANNKSEQHPIPLQTSELCMDRYNGEILQWEGFDDRLGPYLSSECLPLWEKEYNSDSWISPELDEYTIEYNALYKNGNVIGGFRAPIALTEAPTTFTLDGNTVTGQFLGGYRSVYGIYYNNKIYIWKTGEGIVGESPVDSFIEAYNYFSLAKPITYNGANLYAWFSGPYAYVSLVPFHLREKGINGLLLPNDERIRMTLHNPTPVVLEKSVSMKLFSTICGLSSGTRRDTTVQVVTKDYQALFFQAGKYDTQPYTFYLPSSYQDGNVWIAGDVQAARPFDEVYYFSNVYWYNTQHAWYPRIDNCIHDMDGNFVYANNTHASLNWMYNYTLTPSNFVLETYSWGTMTSRMDVIMTPPSGAPSSYVGPDMTGLTWGFNRDSIEHSRFLTLSPLCYKKNDSSFDDNYGIVACTNWHYLSDLENFDSETASKTPFGQSYETTRVQLETNFSLRLLYTAGQLSNISIAEQGYRGSILLPWNSISDAYIDSDSIFFEDRLSGKWYYVNFSAQPTFNVYRNRYLIFNVGDYFNCYDTQENKWYHVADDWNNRLTFGQVANPTSVPGYWLATGVNSNYISDKNPFAGYQSAVLFHKLQSTYSNLIITSGPYETIGYRSRVDDSDEEVISYLDVYKSVRITESATDQASNTTPIYVCSWSNQAYIRNFMGLLWTSEFGNILLNPPLFSKYRTDMFTLVDMRGIKAPLINDQQVEVVLYYALSASDSYENMFCIQNMFFLISDGYIWSIDLIDGLIQNPKKIVDVRMMKYIACNQVAAYFWSSDTKTIYMFTGDAILKPMKGCSIFSEIYDSYYKANSQEVFILTDNGVYIGNSNYMYRIPGLWDTVFQTNYGFALRSSTQLIAYSYYKNDKMTVKIPTMLETMLYGAGDNIVSTTDCIYVRLYNSDMTDESDRTVKITGYTLTDIATPLQEDYKEYTIKHEDWDTKNHTYYLRYQPTYQKGIGMRIRIEADESIVYVGFGNIANTLQISKL